MGAQSHLSGRNQELIPYGGVPIGPKGDKLTLVTRRAGYLHPTRIAYKHLRGPHVQEQV